MEDIIINGVSLDDLKEKKAAIKKDAFVFVSNSIDKVKELVTALDVATSQDEADALATEAYETLNNANVVAGLADVSYVLPYYEEYGGYDSDSILSSIIENSDNEFMADYYGSDKSDLVKLYDLLNGMESESRNWNSSRC